MIYIEGISSLKFSKISDPFSFKLPLFILNKSSFWLDYIVSSENLLILINLCLSFEGKLYFAPNNLKDSVFNPDDYFTKISFKSFLT